MTELAQISVAPNCKIHPHQPSLCPPAAAKPASRTIYRALNANAAQAVDFISEAEKPSRTDINKEFCNSWGLSVWTSKKGVENARKVVPGFRKKAIVTVSLEPKDGLLLETPTNTQPEHHTFWRSVTNNLLRKAVLFSPRAL